MSTLIHSTATGASAPTAAALHHRTHSEPALHRADRPDQSLQPRKLRRDHRSTRRLQLTGWIPCAPARGGDIPDESLSAAGECASGAAELRDNARRAECADSVRRRDATTHDDGSRHTPRRSKCCRDHSPGKCALACRSAGSCRADRLQAERRRAPVPPRSTGQRTGGRRIKGLRKRLPRRCAPKARGSTPINDPGLRLFILLRRAAYSNNTHARAVADAYLPSRNLATERLRATNLQSNRG
jgi:hypothetical protein